MYGYVSIATVIPVWKSIPKLIATTLTNNITYIEV